MTCDSAFDRYLELGKDERVPLQVTLHLFACPACRTAVRRLTRAESIMSAPLRSPDSPPGDPVIRAAIERIRAAGLSYPEVADDLGRVSMTRWLVALFALAAGFAIVPSSSIGQWSRLVFGDAYYLPFYILCGVAVTVFGGLFVGSNIDFFVKRFGITA
jgi:hypothetical protein